MTLTPEQIVKIAGLHVTVYTHRVSIGKEGFRGINLPECEYYLALWQDVVDRKGVDLTPAQLNELQDAIDSGDYDHIADPE